MTAVTVWRIPLDDRPSAFEIATLSDDERARAARFATDLLRDRWLAGHVAMRRILADALRVAPPTIAYQYGEFGKPSLASAQASDIEFSYSDAGGLALVAISGDGPVGIDLEIVHRTPDLLALAESRFAPEEREMLRGVPEEVRADLFYRVWTRKEAVLKAMGTGLTGGLGRFSVIDPGWPLAAAEGITVVVGHSRWRLHDLSLPTGVAGALATSGRTTEFALVDFDAAPH